MIKRFTKCDTIIRDNGEEMSQAEVRDMLNAQNEEIILLKNKEIPKLQKENKILYDENIQLRLKFVHFYQLKNDIKYLEEKGVF